MSNPTDRIAELEQELETTRNLAMASMTTGSDLGVLLRFLQRSFLITDYDSLGQELIKDLAEFGFESCAIIETYTGHIFVKDDSDWGQDIETVITSRLLSGRIVTTGNEIQFNSDRASLLVRGEFTEERVGQLRDIVIMFLDGLRARIESLILEEKSREAQQSKNEFFALMSHELRTPLNPIIGFSSKLAKKVGDGIDERYQNPIVSIKNNGESLLRLINNIIDLGKLEAGEVHINTSNFNVGDAIDHASVKLSDFYNSRQVDIVKSIPDSLYFVADSVRFIDIIYSLVSYSIKHYNSQCITIKAGSDSHKDLGDCLHVAIIDDGKTMEEEHRERVFDNIASRKTSSINESNSIGMGLYLTKKLVELHNGIILVESNADGGNEFNLFFPVFAESS